MLFKAFRAFFIIISLLFIVLSGLAQDATSEPSPAATEVVSETLENDPTAIATEAVVSEPLPVVTQEPILAPIEETSEPSEPIIVATEDPNASSTDDTNVIITIPETSLPEARLEQAFRATFDDGYPSELSAPTGWTPVAIANGQALQSNPTAEPIVYTAASFTDVAVEARFLLNTGEGRLVLSTYSAGLDAAGTVTLYQDDLIVSSGIAPIVAGEWSLLRLEAVEGQVRVSVNGSVIISSAGSVAAGAAGFAASNASILRVDDFAIYGIGTPTLAPLAIEAAVVPSAAIAVPQAIVSLASPVPSTPPDLAIVRTPRPTFGWQVVSGASKYDLQVDDSEAFDSPLTLGSTNLNAPTFTSSVDLAQGPYVWRVIAKDAAGNASAPSNVMHVIVNPALLPAHNSIIVTSSATANVVFTWATAPGTNQYTVQLDEAAQGNFATPLALTCPITTGQNCTIPNLPLGSYVWRVLRTGEVPVGQPVFNSFTVSPAAPPPPRVVGPINGKYLTPTEHPLVNLSWDWGGGSVPSGAPFTYEVQVFTTTDFNTSPLKTFTSNTQSVLAYLENDGTYYWHVRAANQFGVAGSWSGGSSFISDSFGPDSPTMLTPNGTISSARPTFTWTSVPGASRYEIRVVKQFSCMGANPVFVSPQSLTGTSYTIPESAPALVQDEYEVCVIAYDRSQNPSIQSNQIQFRVFLGKKPANGALLPVNTKPAFEWSPTANTASVTLKVATDPQFQTLVHTSPALPGWTTSYVMPTPLPTGSYYWRVERAGEVITNDLTFWQFFVGQVGLVPGPVLLTPEPNQIVSELAVLTWASPLLLPGTSMTAYQLEISTSPTFDTLLFPAFYGDPDVGYFEYSPPANQDNVTFYWRVRGVSSISPSVPVTQWSTSSFIVDSVPPAKPEITSPTQDLLRTVRPTFSWTAVPTATSYQVEVYDDFSDYGTIYSATVTGTSHTIGMNLAQARLTFIVRASDGVNLSEADTLVFTVRLGTTPAEGENVTTNRPTFTWEAVPGATAYTLQIDDDPFYDEDDDPDGQIFPTIQLGNVTSYTLTEAQALPSNGAYYWRLSYDGEASVFPRDSVANFFTVNATFSKPTNLISKTIYGVEDTVFGAVEDAYFEWTAPSPTPIFYDFQVSANDTFTAPYTRTFTAGNASYSLSTDQMKNGINYWRVRGRYGASGTLFGPWSDVKSFTFDNIYPEPPTSSAPLNTVFNTGRPTFTWNPVAGAVGYRVTVLDANTGLPVNASLTNVNVVGTSFTLPNTLTPLTQNNQAGYRWFVEAVDQAGNVSSLLHGFVLYSFQVFAGTSPSHGQALTDSTPTFTWTGVSGTGSATWRVQIDTNIDLSSPDYTSSALPAGSTSFTLPNANALPIGQYYWRVYRTGESTSNLKGYPFQIVSSSVTNIPYLLTPLDRAVISQAQMNAGVLASWTAIGPTSGFSGDYRVDVSTSSAFTPASIIVVGNADNATQIRLFDYLADGTYYWRVVPILGSFNTPAPAGTVVRSFTVDTTGPVAPALRGPVDLATYIYSRTPGFTWYASTGATHYVLEIASDPGFETIVRTVVTSALSYRLLPSQLLDNGQYYWRVTARDSLGNPWVIPSEGTLSTSSSRAIIINTPASCGADCPPN